MNDSPTSRRRFLQGLLAAAVLPAAFGASAADAPLPHLTLDDPAAKSLNYVEDAKKAEKDPVYKPGSKCSGCALYQAAQEKGGYAPCAAFPGKAVAKNGWCKAFAAKPA